MQIQNCTFTQTQETTETKYNHKSKASHPMKFKLHGEETIKNIAFLLKQRNPELCVTFNQ